MIISNIRCLSFPESFSTNNNITPPIPDSATLTQSFAAGNITASQTVNIVDSYISAVYASGSNELNPYGCDVNGLAMLDGCESEKSGLLLEDKTVRGVTLAGAFVPALWATKDKVLSMDEVKKMYSRNDFEEMLDLGVNTVQIPIYTSDFVEGGEVLDTLDHLMGHVSEVGLKAILVLVDSNQDTTTGAASNSEEITKQITAAATYAKKNKSILAIQTPSALPSHIGAVRTASSTLPILVPLNKGELNSLSFSPDDALYAALDVGATTSVADVASSDSVGDRMKMFYHESLICIDRSPIEWMECYKDMPVYVTSGFDLGVDDCINEGEDTFRDYGQCDRFEETIGSGWWERHRKSLAERKLFTYSKGLGFSFSAWKLYGEKETGVIDSPAKLLCLKDVAAAGLLPSLKSSSKSIAGTCLNGPEADFELGDDTLAPTESPPPDCGYGWWNATTKKCDYWIPPVPTPMPTEKPTMPCPSCEETSTMALVQSAAVGAVVALVLNWGVKKMFGGRDGYETLP